MSDKLPEKVEDIELPIPSENVGKKIIIFGQETCPDCARVKKFLSENAIEYEYHDIKFDKAALKWVRSFSTHIPVVITLNQSILYSPSNEKLHNIISLGSVNQKLSMVEPQLFDTIIIGAGPAGLTAAIYAVRKSLKVLLISKNIGGQAVSSGSVENYPGFTMITGNDLANRFKESVEQFKGDGIWIKEGVAVTSIEGEEGSFSVKTERGEYKGKTVIIASGRVPRMLRILGEKDLLGKGVATCATCDGPLYRGKNVVVVGGGNSALDAAYSLMKIAKSVTIVNITEEVNGDEILKKNVIGAQNVQVLNLCSVVEIMGKSFVEGVKINDTKNHTERIIDADGVFIEIGWTPSIEFAPQLAKDKMNQLIVDEFGRTSQSGIWAAGDVNNLWGEQIIIAAGEGAKTALTVAEHIAKIPHQHTSNIHEG